MIYYLNGKYIANSTCEIDIGDRGFLLGDGVFTTIKAVNGKLIHFDDHIKRLIHDSTQIKINISWSLNEIHEICQSILLQNELHNKESIIRITVTRGVSDRGINISHDK